MPHDTPPPTADPPLLIDEAPAERDRYQLAGASRQLDDPTYHGTDPNQPIPLS